MAGPPPEVLQEFQDSLDAYEADIIQALEQHFGFIPKRAKSPQPESTDEDIE
jgi:hypothetical protein